MMSPQSSDSDETIDYILGEHRGRFSPEEIALITQAYEYAAQVHRGQVRASGEPYITHCIEVARILTSERMDAQTIAAGLLHDTIEDCNVSRDDLRDKFGDVIAGLVDGVTKISSLPFSTSHEQRQESLRKMILAMAGDIRVIFVKLADRLHNIQTLQYLPAEKRKRIANDTVEIFARLANRLGMTRFKAQLEDGAFRYLHPEEFQLISKHVAKRRVELDALVEGAMRKLKAALAEQGVVAEVRGRTKHIYSIYQKMQRQGTSLDEIFDIIGVRVICESPDKNDCYKVLGIVHSMWRPIENRFKDYIALPKENQYRSIHTTVVGPGGWPLEIQIRTRQMHQLAEEGIAAHWKYKERTDSAKELEERIKWLRKIVESFAELNPSEFDRTFQQDVLGEHILCFTPKGDIVELPRGATALDFAFHVHTEVGLHCVGVKVNQKHASLRQILQNADIVEVITSPKGHPSKDWLTFVTTSRARTKIKHWLKVQNFQQNVERGKELIAKVLRSRGIPLEWATFAERVQPFLKTYRVGSVDELFAEIGFGSILAQGVVAKAYPLPAPAPKPKTNHRRRKSQGVVVDGIPNAAVRFAHCCLPVPGDLIIGYVTVGRGVTIHTKNCRSLLRILDTDERAAARLLPASWDAEHPQTRQVGIRIECRDRQGLLRDVTEAISAANVFILESKTKTVGEKATLCFLVEVKDLDQLERLFASVREVKGVMRATRDGSGNSSNN